MFAQIQSKIISCANKIAGKGTNHAYVISINANQLNQQTFFICALKADCRWQFSQTPFEWKPACLSQFSEFLIKGFQFAIVGAAKNRQSTERESAALAVNFNGKAMMKGSLSLLWPALGVNGSEGERERASYLLPRAVIDVAWWKVLRSLLFLFTVSFQ